MSIVSSDTSAPACPLCGRNKSSHVFSVMDWTFKATSKRFEVRRCTGCTAGYVEPRPGHQELAGYYPPRFYWSHEGTGEPLGWDEVIARRRSQLEAKAAVLASMKAGRLLDIGAQKGEFVWFMRDRGWEVEGVELENSIPNPKEMPIRYGDFLKMTYPPESFNAITAWAVLEHVDDPAMVVRRAAELLKPGGRFVALVTNFNSIQGRLMLADDYPRHLTLFTRRAVRDLAGRTGFRVNAIWTDQKIFGGTLNGGFVYLLKRFGGYSRDEALEEWKQSEDPYRFWTQWRGRPSSLVLNMSRIDRAVTRLPERMLDALGHGFIMTFVLEKMEEARA